MAKVKFGDVIVRANTKEDRFDTTKEYYVGGEHIETDRFLITKHGIIQGSTIGPMFYFGFKAGQVLLASRSPDLRKAGMVTFDGICSEKTFVIETRNENILLQDFLPVIVRSNQFWTYANNNQSGSVNHFINWTTFASYEFELPTIENQRRIANTMWAIVRLQSAYESLFSKTDELVKSEFSERFGNPILNERAWLSKPLCDVLADGCTVTYGIVQTEDDIPDGIPVFRPVDITSGYVPTRSELKRTRKEISDKYARTLLKGDELLITVRGSVGETFQTTNEFAGCNVARNIVPLRANPACLVQRFLQAVIETPAFQDKLASITKGVALKGVNMCEFKLMNIILPPISDQQHFVSFLNTIAKCKLAVQQSLDSLTTAQKALMNQCFQ